MNIQNFYSFVGFTQSEVDLDFHNGIIKNDNLYPVFVRVIKYARKCRKNNNVYCVGARSRSTCFLITWGTQVRRVTGDNQAQTAQRQAHCCQSLLVQARVTAARTHGDI
ncbi:hypothetical protein J6590_032836 [Homalodisca vitripennis]|nr:hypothetical protein J6590_032836 [Homalodisca vitripennis]